MPAAHNYVDAAKLMGTWPMVATGVNGPSSGDYGLLPRSLINQATILGSRRDPSGGYDTAAKSFYLYVDGVQYTVDFVSGPLSLDDVITEINSDTSAVGSDVAFNDNGFLRLKSPTLGEGSSLEIQVTTSGEAILAELGLMSGYMSEAGDLYQSEHVDPNRQVSTNGQVVPNYGELFDINSFNRIAFQMAINSDKSEHLLSSKPVAVQKEFAVSSYSPPADPGFTLTDDVFVGSATTPSSSDLEKMFAILDTDGNEARRDVEDITDTSGADTVQCYVDGTSKIQYVELGTLGFFTATDDTNNVFVRLSGLAGSGNNILFKIIEYVDSRTVGIKNVDPSDGSVIEMNEGPSAAIDAERVVVTPTKIYVEEVLDTVGGSRVEGVVSQRCTGAIDRIDRNNRVVSTAVDFSASGVVPGDRMEISGAGQDRPYNNDGFYRVKEVIDANTVELLSDSYGPAFLNTIEGTGYGTLTVRSDGQFFNDPFVKLNIHPETGSDLRVIYLSLSSMRDASDDPAFISGGSIQWAQETDWKVQKTLMAVIGPSTDSFDEYLYDDARNSLENLYFRITKEHDDRGRHSTIWPDQVVIGTDGADVHADTTLPRANLEVVQAGLVNQVNISTWRSGTSSGSTLNFYRSQSSILGELTPTSDGQHLGEIYGWGVDSGSIERSGASIKLLQDEAAGATWIPGCIEWHTTDTSGSSARRMVLGYAGWLGIGTYPDTDTWLHVQHGSTDVSARFENTTSEGAIVELKNTQGSYNLEADDDAFYITDLNAAATRYKSDNTGDHIWYDEGGVLTAHLDTDGRLGLNRAPTGSYFLDVYGDEAWLRLESSGAGNAAGIHLSNSEGDYWLYADNDDFTIYDRNANQLRYVIANGGEHYWYNNAGTEIARLYSGGFQVRSTSPWVEWYDTSPAKYYQAGVDASNWYVSRDNTTNKVFYVNDYGIGVFSVPTSGYQLRTRLSGASFDNFYISDSGTTTIAAVNSNDNYNAELRLIKNNVQKWRIVNNHSQSDRFEIQTGTGSRQFSITTSAIYLGDDTTVAGAVDASGRGDFSSLGVSSTDTLAAVNIYQGSDGRFIYARTSTTSGTLEIGTTSTNVYIEGNQKPLHVGTLGAYDLSLYTSGSSRWRVSGVNGSLRASVNYDSANTVGVGGIFSDAGTYGTFVQHVVLSCTAPAHQFPTLAGGAQNGDNQRIYMCMGRDSMGAYSRGFTSSSSDAYGFIIGGFIGGGSTTTTTSARGAVTLQAAEVGAAVDDPDYLEDDENLVVFLNWTDAKHIFKGDGDIYTDTGVIGSFDDYKDAMACQDMAHVMSRKYDNIMEYNEKKFEKLGIMEGGFVSHKRLNSLMLCGIGELYQVLDRLCKRFGLTYEELRQEVRA